MKKFVSFMALLFLLCTCASSWSADVKITELPAATSMEDTELLVFVSDPEGSPVTKKITKANALSTIPNGSVGTTQSLADKSTKLATTAYVDTPATQTFTMADSGDANHGTGTLTPTANVSRVAVSLTCSDAHGCTVTMGETGAVAGATVIITNISANHADFANQTGVLALASTPFDMLQGESLTLEYKNNQWYEVSRAVSSLRNITFGGFTANKVIQSNVSGNLVAGTTGTGVITALGVNTGAAGGLPTIIGSGATALDFGSTATGNCATVIQATCTNCVATDVVIFNANASIKAVTGYVPAATGGFSITAFPDSGHVNFEACNWTAGPVDPGSITVNWLVIR